MKGFIIFLFMAYGIIIGINLNPDSTMMELTGIGLTNELETDSQDVAGLLDETEAMRQRIIDLRTTIESMETERAEDNTELQRLLANVQEYQMMAGHRSVQGPGIVILLEGIYEENIAPMIHQRKYLITLVNELRTNGAEVVSINDHRITGRSEMTLAGNHIQVNGKPVAPPYQVKAIGNVNEFKRYVAARTFIFEFMESDGIISTITYEENMTIAGPHREKNIHFLEVDSQ